MYFRKTSEKLFRKVSMSVLLTTVYESVTPNNKQRFKGLGEMPADQLWFTTLDPTKRKLIKLSLDDYNKDTEKFEILMGKDADKRKIFMSNFEIDLEDLDG